MDLTAEDAEMHANLCVLCGKITLRLAAVFQFYNPQTVA